MFSRICYFKNLAMILRVLDLCEVYIPRSVEQTPIFSPVRIFKLRNPNPRELRRLCNGSSEI
jgi:hypothetical protein